MTHGLLMVGIVRIERTLPVLETGRLPLSCYIPLERIEGIAPPTFPLQEGSSSTWGISALARERREQESNLFRISSNFGLANRCLTIRAIPTYFVYVPIIFPMIISAGFHMLQYMTIGTQYAAVFHLRYYFFFSFETISHRRYIHSFVFTAVMKM